MSAEQTYTTLVEMGLDQAVAREAAKRYDANVERAAEWCLGDGMTWKESEQAPPASTGAPHTGHHNLPSFEHHEVRPPDFSTTDRPSTPRSPPPALPPRRLPPTPQLKSNNPFYTGTGTGIASTSTSTSNEITSYQPNSSSPSKKPNSNLAVSFENPDAEYDEELSRAIQLSQQSMSDSAPHDHSHAHATDSADRGDGTTVTVQSAADVDMGGDNGDTTDHQEQGRTDRERSLRATAPPPSPEMKGLDGDSMRTLFGPSNKEEVGQTAVVPAGTYDNPTGTSKEDEDLNRAIQDSLMTASFHSQSAAAIEKPSPMIRKRGAPLVFLSESNMSTYASNFLQAMHAVPQLRQAVLTSVVEGIEPWRYASTLHDLKRLFSLAETEEQSFIEVDSILKDIRSGTTPHQLPPRDAITAFHGIFAGLIDAALSNTIRSQSQSNAGDEEIPNPELLLHSHTYPPVQPAPAHVYFTRNSYLANKMHPHLADVLWRRDRMNAALSSTIGTAAGTDGKSNEDAAAAIAAELQDQSPTGEPEAIIEFADVLTVLLHWGWGAKREPWELEERVVLDRYLKENQAWALQIRAQQAVAAGNIRRLKERIEQLSIHQGNNIHDSISALIAHYDSSAPPDSPADGEMDEISTSTRLEIKAKLEKTLKILKEKTESLLAEVEREESVAGGKLFEVDDPEKNTHVYELKGILMHDGALVQGRHLYSFVKGDDGRWWRIQDHEIEETSLDAIQNDRTGLFMEGGPYCLLYSRVGERPKRRRSATSILPNELDLTATGPTQTTSENQGHVAISADRDQDEPMVSVTPVEESKSEEGKDIDQEFGSKNPFATATAVPTMTGDENTTKHTIESSLSEDIEPRPASSDAINAPAPAPTSPHTAITTSPKQATVIQSAAAAPPVAVPGVERDVQTRQAALAAAAQAALSRRKDGGQVE